MMQNGFNSLYMSYLYGKVKERFSFLSTDCDIKKSGDCAQVVFRAEKEYCPYIRKFVEENMADIIVVGYKYAYFEKRLRLPLLSNMQKRILLTALVAADYKDDKIYVRRRLRGYKQYCLDGLFYFRLTDLKRRWEEIVEYIPTDMGEASMDGFLEFLTEEGEGKLFLKDGRVYGDDYRPLSKSLLTGVKSPVGEILLGGAEEVYCFGEADENTRAFLKKYYGEKVIFC